MSEELEKVLEEWKKLLKKPTDSQEQPEPKLPQVVTPTVTPLSAKILEQKINSLLEDLERLEKEDKELREKLQEKEKQELAKKFGEEYAEAYIALKRLLKPVLVAKRDKDVIRVEASLFFATPHYLPEWGDGRDLTNLIVLFAQLPKPEENAFFLLEYDVRVNYKKKLKNGKYARYIKCFKYTTSFDEATKIVNERKQIIEKLEALKQPQQTSQGGENKSG